MCHEVHKPVMKTAIQRIPKLAGMAAVIRGMAINRFLSEANSSMVMRNIELDEWLTEDGDEYLNQSQEQDPAYAAEENFDRDEC